MRELSFAIASGSGTIDVNLHRSLVFLKDRVTKACPRVRACGPRKMLRLYTDASHESNFSGIGAVCYDSAGTELWHFGDSLNVAETNKTNVDDRGTIISELEAMAVCWCQREIVQQHALGCDLFYRQCCSVSFNDRGGIFQRRDAERSFARSHFRSHP